MILRWLFSKNVREACALRKHVQRLLNAQRDLMTPVAVQSVQAALHDLQGALRDGVKKSDLRNQMDVLEKVAGKWLRPYPHPVWRENVEVFLVALAVAMGIRTFFLQPFKIPTGSMQPTLYGVNSVPDFSPSTIDYSAGSSTIEAQVKRQIQLQSELKIPTGWQRIKAWFEGNSYLRVVAQADGEVEAISPPVRFLIFNLWQKMVIGGHTQIIWFPPDYGEQTLAARAGFDTLVVRGQRVNLYQGHLFHKGDDVIKMKVSAGDHLFVDRLTYNFRKPERGEIVVFETAGIPKAMRDNPPYWNIPNNQFYIKRLVGLGGETIWLHQDYIVTNAPRFDDDGRVPVGNLMVNGKPLTASTPHFENLYAWAGVPAGATTIPYYPNHYYGHAMIRNLAPGQKYHVQPGEVFVMGDNTMNSLDSRFWGDLPEPYVIGKAFFVYWPLTKRFGIGQSIATQ